MIDLAINVSENNDWKVITLKGELDDFQSSKLTDTFNRLIDQSKSPILFLILMRYHLLIVLV